MISYTYNQFSGIVFLFFRHFQSRITPLTCELDATCEILNVLPNPLQLVIIFFTILTGEKRQGCQ